MDLISGRYSVSRNSPSPFQLNAFESLSVSTVYSVLINQMYFIWKLSMMNRLAFDFYLKLEIIYLFFYFSMPYHIFESFT